MRVFAIVSSLLLVKKGKNDDDDLLRRFQNVIILMTWWGVGSGEWFALLESGTIVELFRGMVKLAIVPYLPSTLYSRARSTSLPNTKDVCITCTLISLL